MRLPGVGRLEAPARGWDQQHAQQVPSINEITVTADSDTSIDLTGLCTSQSVRLQRLGPGARRTARRAGSRTAGPVRDLPPSQKGRPAPRSRGPTPSHADRLPVTRTDFTSRRGDYRRPATESPPGQRASGSAPRLRGPEFESPAPRILGRSACSKVGGPFQVIRDPSLGRRMPAG